MLLYLKILWLSEVIRVGMPLIKKNLFLYEKTKRQGLVTEKRSCENSAKRQSIFRSKRKDSGETKPANTFP